MHPTDRPAPRELGGIANFGWVVPGEVARGEQPRPEHGGYAALVNEGITALLLLREAQEDAKANAGRPFDAYNVAEEEAQARLHGLTLVHVPFVDRTLPDADGLLDALVALWELRTGGHVPYVHCMAGIGRTGLVSALWLLAHGAGSDEAAQEFVHYWLDFGVREESVIGPHPNGILSMYGFGAQWAALKAVAEALAGPMQWTTPELETLSVPEVAPAWVEAAQKRLMPWLRERRETTARS